MYVKLFLTFPASVLPQTIETRLAVNRPLFGGFAFPLFNVITVIFTRPPVSSPKPAGLFQASARHLEKRLDESFFKCLKVNNTLICINVIRRISGNKIPYCYLQRNRIVINRLSVMFTENHIPLYLKLYWKLRDDILDLEMSPGERMPTVEQLHKQYGVSQGTVRKALILLEKDGLIVKNRALGIYINEKVKASYIEPVLTPESLKQTMQSFETLQTSDGWINASRRIQKVFDDQSRVLKKNKIFRFQSLRVDKTEGRRKLFISAFFPAWVMSGLSSAHIQEIAAEGFLKIKDIKGDRFLQTIRAWNCSEEMGEKLGLLEGTPILRRTCVIYTADNRILLYLEFLTTTHAVLKEVKIDWKA